jgi:Flp pilus assembly protein protease CpaA
MEATKLFHQVQTDLVLYNEQYKLCVESATVALLCYIGWRDLRTFKISNESVLLLIFLYALYAFVVRSQQEILSSIILAAIMFGLLLYCYAKRLVGGGDVKLVPVVCLWVGAHCALLFSMLLLVFICLHFIAARMGWTRTATMGQRQALPYAPSVAAAMIATILLGCL